MPTFTSDYYTFAANGNYVISFWVDLGLTVGATANVGLFVTGNAGNVSDGGLGNNLVNYPLHAFATYTETGSPQLLSYTWAVSSIDGLSAAPYLYFSIYRFTTNTNESLNLSDVSGTSNFTVTGPSVTDDGGNGGGTGTGTGTGTVSGSGTGGVTSNPSAGSQPIITPNPGSTAMSVISVKPISERMSLSHSGPMFTIVFVCEFTGDFDSAYVYQNQTAIGTPDYGDYVLGTGEEMYCSATNAEIATNSAYRGTTTTPGAYHYTCVFSTITPERLDLPPTARPAVVQGGGLELTEVRRTDINQKPMVNSVGDYFENLPEFYVPGSEFTMTWNVAFNPATLAQTFSFSTNKDGIWGQAAYAGIIRKITHAPAYEVYQGVLIEFWRLTVPITFRNDGQGWNFQPFDYGYRYNNSGTIQNYVDQTTQVYGPVFLDGSGNLLNSNGTTNGSPAVIFPAASGSGPAGYQTLTAQSWSGLSFPVSPFA